MKKMVKGLTYKPATDILISLNSYNELFSGFDPRAYSQKSLSKDFLCECEKVSADKPKRIHLKLLIDRKKRNLLEEVHIIKRMKEHFNQHFLEKKKELLKMKSVGMIWFLAGCFLIVLTAFLMEKEVSFLTKVLINIAHPGGWFFLWEGLAKIIIHSKEKQKDYLFNKKMREAKISFVSR